MKNHPKALLFGTCLTVIGMLLLPGWGMAQNVVLQSGGSSATINLGDNSGGTGTVGMNSWAVGPGGIMQNELNLQWFWVSVSSINSGGVQSIDGLGGLHVNSQTPNSLDAQYSSGPVTVDVQYTLLGGGNNSGSADITENVTVFNTGNTSFNVNLFEYSNFNLNQNNANSLSILGGPGAYDEAYQTSGATSLAEGIIDPNATSTEAGLAGATLSDVEAGSLNNNLSAGPGNVAWAFEWSTTLNGGANFPVLKDKELSVAMAPEPSSIALLGLGLGAVGLIRRRQAS
jgi:hypothetical protein